MNIIVDATPIPGDLVTVSVCSEELVETLLEQFRRKLFPQQKPGSVFLNRQKEWYSVSDEGENTILRKATTLELRVIIGVTALRLKLNEEAA